MELHEISADVMEVLLDFVYTETVNVSVENVQELLPAACLLQLNGKSLQKLAHAIYRHFSALKIERIGQFLAHLSSKAHKVSL